MKKFYILLTISLIQFAGCRDAMHLKDVPYVEGAHFTMNITGATVQESANLIANMRIFLFTRDKGSEKGVLKEEVLNLDKSGGANKISSEHVTAGEWTMVAISSLSAEKMNIEPKYAQSREQLFQQFTPGSLAAPSKGGNCNEFMILTKDITILDGQTEIVNDAKFQRAVGRVRVTIVDVTGNIYNSSKDHIVEIIGVPSKLSLYGGLLDKNNVHSRMLPDTLARADNPMIRPIEISLPVSGTTTGHVYPYAEFIIPAYDDNAPIATTSSETNNNNKRLFVRVRLRTDKVEEVYYDNMVEITEKSLAANKTLNIKLTVRANLEATVEILDWEPIEIPSDITQAKIFGVGDIHLINIHSKRRFPPKRISGPLDTIVIKSTGNYIDKFFTINGQKGDSGYQPISTSWIHEMHRYEAGCEAGIYTTHLIFEYHTGSRFGSSWRQGCDSLVKLQVSVTGSNGNKISKIIKITYPIVTWADRNVGIDFSGLEGMELENALKSAVFNSKLEALFDHVEAEKRCNNWVYDGHDDWMLPVPLDFFHIQHNTTMLTDKIDYTSFILNNGKTIHFPHTGTYLYSYGHGPDANIEAVGVLGAYSCFSMDGEFKGDTITWYRRQRALFEGRKYDARRLDWTGSPDMYYGDARAPARCVRIDKRPESYAHL